MREYTPENITDVVIEQMSTTSDPRMKEVMEAAVRHLHAFAREVKLTPAEWINGIEFMTKVGQMCSPARQEFILLSDTRGPLRARQHHARQDQDGRGNRRQPARPVLPREHTAAR